MAYPWQTDDPQRERLTMRGVSDVVAVFEVDGLQHVLASPTASHCGLPVAGHVAGKMYCYLRAWLTCPDCTRKLQEYHRAGQWLPTWYEAREEELRLMEQARGKVQAG